MRIALARSDARAEVSEETAALLEAEQFCADMARREAKNFYWGFIALPRPKRMAIYALYDFARQVDDEADLDHEGDAVARLALQRARLQQLASGDGADPVALVLGHAMHRYGIPVEELEQIIGGVESDLLSPRYQTWAQLENYCRAVASSVGRMCVRIFGFRHPSAMEYADDLGAAMQLTNILRDVREDISLGRFYLPLDELSRFGLAEAQVREAALNGGPDAPVAERWADFVRHQSDRARTLFRSGLQVVDLIPRSSGACVLTMAGIYRRILSRIVKDPTVVFVERVSLSTGAKTRVAMASWLKALSR